MNTPVQRLALHTSDRLSLRAELATPDEPTSAAVICHPHPLHGGTMFAPVVDALFTDLPSIGVACLRFNFRGVQGSDGRHDHGDGERLDLTAGLEHLAETFPGLPLWCMGWSFGADVALAVSHPRLAGWFAVAPPLKIIDPSDMVAATDERPKYLCVPEHDQFNPPAAAAATTADWQSTTIEIVPMADHFLNGHLSAVTAAARQFTD